MIQSFASRETERLFHSRLARSLPPDILDRARKKMLQLDIALNLDDLRVPASNRLEKLRGAV